MYDEGLLTDDELECHLAQLLITTAVKNTAISGIESGWGESVCGTEIKQPIYRAIVEVGVIGKPVWFYPLEENMSGHQPWSEIKNKMGLVRRAKLWFGVKWDLLMMWISGE
jgi:hypothetical protein